MKSSYTLGVLDFLTQETGPIDRKLLLLTAASGTANALILAVVNASVGSMSGIGPQWRYFALFVLSLALFVYSLRYVLSESDRLAEQAIRNVRVRLADKIRRCDLFAVESIGDADIHARISRETATIAQSARPMFNAAQSSIMVIFTMFYIATVSPLAVLLCIAMIVGGVGIYLRDRKIFELGLKEASRCEDELFSSLTCLLKGFKELRINRLKSDDVFAEFSSAAGRVQDVRGRVAAQFAANITFVEAFMHVLVGGMVFLLPALSASFSGSIVKIVAAVLFLIGPLGNAVMMIPVFAQVNVTIGNLRRLEAKLDSLLSESASGDEEPLNGCADFDEIRLNGVGFTYRGPDGSEAFRLGPITTSIRRGEIVFMVGGNGSGKTTFLKLFTALYLPEEGSIRLGSTEITARNVQFYRNLFSAIFSDFHLFDKLYGLQDADPERVEALLKLMKISHKTSYRDGRFSNIQLSTGQRKRLALVVAYMEDKPVYVFDEVAADQDPGFRTYFYEVLLPDLKKSGKTVVVVSHDDRFFHVADRVLKMDYGTIEDASKEAIARRRTPRRRDSRPSPDLVS
jgi:putative pyoverdin transport system ATP-binding/permease protein